MRGKGYPAMTLRENLLPGGNRRCGKKKKGAEGNPPAPATKNFTAGLAYGQTRHLIQTSYWANAMSGSSAIVMRY